MAQNLTTVVSSKTKEVLVSRDRPCVIIGERINPTWLLAVPRCPMPFSVCD